MATCASNDGEWKDNISEVKASVGAFATFAEQAGIKEKTATFINAVIEANMVKI